MPKVYLLSFLGQNHAKPPVLLRKAKNWTLGHLDIWTFKPTINKGRTYVMRPLYFIGNVIEGLFHNNLLRGAVAVAHDIDARLQVAVTLAVEGIDGACSL